LAHEYYLYANQAVIECHPGIHYHGHMKTTKPRILLVEDDLLSRLSLKSRLEQMGEVLEAPSRKDAIILLKDREFDLAFVDLDLEAELAGLDIITLLKEKNIYSVVLSGREDENIIEQAYTNGCRDYLAKPFTKSSIELIFKKFASEKNKKKSLQALKDIFLTSDDSLIRELEIIDQALLSQRPILITGESGTGKTFLAKFIHELIDSTIPFIHLNCAEISESLIESELFGYEKGAFTGAVKTKKGMLELADGGILFLDEIATMPLSIQKKLLKAIEEKSFYPLGSEKLVKSDFRLISATCENLQKKIEKQEFRADFYYRIEGFNVTLKSLRERSEDLNTLIQHFVKKGDRRIVFDSMAKQIMKDFSWPGNVRELEKTIEVLQTRENGIVTAADLATLLNKPTSKNSSPEIDLEEVKRIGLKTYIESIESQILEMALKANKDKVRKTLADLKLSNNSFYRIMDNLKTKGGDRA
jgi:DNA-binding NtrC family response regulator